MRRSIVVLGLATLAAACASAGGGFTVPTDVTYASALGIDLSSMQVTASGLYYAEEAAGSGPAIARGDRVRLHYAGFLPDATPLDASVGGDPFEFRVGRDNVIKAWDEGVTGMKAGGRRILVVPPQLGYGARGDREAGVPANSVLVFEIQIVEIVNDDR